MSKSSVINKGVKCDIIIALVNHAFNDKKKALDDKYDAWVISLRGDLVDGEYEYEYEEGTTP